VRRAARTHRFRDVPAAVRRRGHTVESNTPASRRLRTLAVELDSLSPRQRPAVTELLHEIGTIEYPDDDLREAPHAARGSHVRPGVHRSVYVWATWTRRRHRQLHGRAGRGRRWFAGR
jgi:hypothetical protein